MDLSQELIEICKKPEYQIIGKNVVIPEPYIPYIPKNWNGILVLAESQNLSNPETKYKKELETMRLDGTDNIYRRLELRKPEDLGIKPWDDDGYIKFALTVMFPGIRLEETAVSNAVPWSRADGINLNPTPVMEEEAKSFWKEIFEKWKTYWNDESGLKKIVNLGKVAERVIDNMGMTEKCLNLVFPSPRIMNSVFSMFDEYDLKKMFPELYSDVEYKYDDFVKEYEKYRSKKKNYMIIYACYAINSLRRQKGSLNKERIFQILTENNEKIRKFSVNYLALFGSAAREELKPDSDIDVLVEIEEKTLDNYMDLKFFLEDLFGRDVDLVMRGTIKPRIKDKVLSEAIDIDGFYTERNK